MSPQGDEILSNSTIYCQPTNACVLERLEEEVVPRAGLLFDPKGKDITALVLLYKHVNSTRADSGTVLYVHAVKVLTFDSCKKGKLLSDTKGQPDSEMIWKWSCTALAEVAILESLGNIEFIKRCVGLPIAHGCPSLRGFWVMGTAQGLQSLASVTVTSCRVTDLSLEAVGKGCTNIKSMCLRECFVFDGVVVALARAAGSRVSLVGRVPHDHPNGHRKCCFNLQQVEKFFPGEVCGSQGFASTSFLVDLPVILFDPCPSEAVQDSVSLD
ncbi:hypothetical protein MTR67_021673 [Solanum verrucosum]|uniref:Uncharacterized protein n=1 Tax=Solanum verrucosum TaxID=315347 RepID=A0AAF0QS10_SOLVR|nr:hypothetical protein MTR67_021673 [Solanum verrucosum]